ncbi:response regulator transcription factor [Streptosporangium sp. CA-115845]|uniref:response regulator transcription factor n=1 Tax=Streptosporangium sp. CA-115845 TaxID=3240071 RepID=UPI003D8E7549
MRVLVVDDQQLMREGLVALLDLVDDVEVVGDAGNGELRSHPGPGRAEYFGEFGAVHSSMMSHGPRGRVVPRVPCLSGPGVPGRAHRRSTP